MDYFDRMRGLRQDHDLTQKQIADKLGVAQNTYSQYKNGGFRFKCFRCRKCPL